VSSLALIAHCANPNNHSGSCDGPKGIGGILVVAAIAAIVLAYLAFWFWLRRGRRSRAPNT
jgi:hypothetical protein